MIKSAKTLDLRGYRCPAPVIRLEATLRRAQPGDAFDVHCDDPIAVVDIPHYCRQAGNAVELITKTDDYCVFRVTRGPNSGD